MVKDPRLWVLNLFVSYFFTNLHPAYVLNENPAES